VTHSRLTNERLCGVGVAGAGFDDYSPHPKRLSRERAIRNLAGILGTSVLEAIVDRVSDDSQSIETARGMRLDQELVEKIDAIAETEYWIDHDAIGPFAQQNFTYANACVDAKQVATTLKLDAAKLARSAAKVRPAVRPDQVPAWINRDGKQRGGRLCAVGFSLPTFFADNTFEAVVEDIRGQLAEVIETLVSQYTEEVTTNRSQTVQMMTVATTQAISKGVVVTDFWFDRDGRGPSQKARSTYGWGCVYPVDILQQGLATVEKKGADSKTIAKVRERAAHAFEELDAETAKHASKAAAGGSQPR
jgi:hypothetical protein